MVTGDGRSAQWRLTREKEGEMMWRSSRILPTVLVLAFALVAVVAQAPAEVLADDLPEIDWVEGPAVVDLGDVAQIDLGEEYAFVDGQDAREMLEYSGEQISELEVGAVFPKAEDSVWSVWFDYDPIGYVKDDEKESLDSKALLESIKQANEEANKARAEKGFPPLRVIGWYEEPHYDADTHNLVWCVLGETLGTEIVNYNTRLLGRNGYMAVYFVTDRTTLDSTKPYLQDIIGRFSWKSGKSYGEYRSGDRVAEIGLTALVAGGAAAVAAKVGLFGKIWKFIVGGVVAVGAAFWRKIRSLFGRGGEPTPPTAGSSGGGQPPIMS